MHAAAGQGCHPSRPIALLRALTEAAQSRLTIIAGSRDDFYRDDFKHARSADTTQRTRALATDIQGPMRAFDDGPSWDGETFEDDVAWALDRLRSVGDRARDRRRPDDAGVSGAGHAGGYSGTGGRDRSRDLSARRAGAGGAARSGMSVYVFTGPTISAEDAAAELDARYLPPVAQGDVYRVALTRPRAIGIIDGYFERVPAVWHKEILWAMSQGIPVFGSASMGALRAAELAPFGMEGVGEIFEAYRDGRLEDDDEVALTHGSAEEGYRPLSEAMVNIRSTLRHAEEARVIGASTRSTLERIAKDLFYPDRDYPVADQAWCGARASTRRNWPRSRPGCRTGRVDQKRIDAVAMLRTMRDRSGRAESATKPPTFFLEYTVFLDHLVKAAGQVAPGTDGGTETIAFDALLDEMLLDGDLYARAHQGALARHLAIAEAQRQGFVVDDDALDEGDRGVLPTAWVGRRGPRTLAGREPPRSGSGFVT